MYESNRLLTATIEFIRWCREIGDDFRPDVLAEALRSEGLTGTTIADVERCARPVRGLRLDALAVTDAEPGVVLVLPDPTLN